MNGRFDQICPRMLSLCRWTFAAIQGPNMKKMICCQAKDHTQRPHLAHHFMLLAQMWVEADKHDFADLAVTTLRLPSLSLSALLGVLSLLPRLSGLWHAIPATSCARLLTRRGAPGHVASPPLRSSNRAHRRIFRAGAWSFGRCGAWQLDAGMFLLKV